MGADHQGWFPPLSLRLRVCVWGRDRLRFVCLSSSLWLSVEWVLESHGYLSADWRRKHNPEEEGCRYQLVHAGARGHSARREAGRHTIARRADSTSLTLLSFVSLSPLLFVFRPALWPAPRLLFTAEFRIALQCLRWLLCSKHRKVRYCSSFLFLNQSFHFF